jgi:hypothetical protein
LNIVSTDKYRAADAMLLSHLGYEENLKALMERLDEEYVRSKKRLP